MKNQIGLGCAAILLAAAGSARAQLAEMVYASSAHAGTTNKADVPGMSGVKFSNFGRVYKSPTDGHWSVIVATDITSTAQDQVLLIGSGMTGVVAAQEGVTSYGGGETMAYGLSVPTINDRGQWAMAFARTGASTDQRVVRFDNPGYTVIARTGDPASPPLSSGVVYGTAFSSAYLMNDGQVSFLASNIVDQTTGSNEAAMSANGTVATIISRVDVPLGQAGGGADAWDDIDTDGFSRSADGSRWLAVGRVSTVTGASRIVVGNGSVLLQQGVVIPGSTFTSPVSTISEAFMEANGTWFARGANADGVTWIVRNSAVIAASGRPLFPGSTENWGSFQLARGNALNDYVIIGRSNNSDTLRDDVIVLNNTRVIVRESDPVDLNGDHVAETNLFIGLLRDRAALGDDGYLYFATRMKAVATSGTGLGANSSLLRVALGPITHPCNLADITGIGGPPSTPDGLLTGDDFNAFIGAFADGSALADVVGIGGQPPADGLVTGDDFNAFIGAFASGCP